MLGTGAGVDIARIERDAVSLARSPAPTGSETERLAWIDQNLAGAPGERSRDRVGNLVWRLGADMHAPTERIERASIGLGAAQLDRVLRRLLIEDNRIEPTPDRTAEGKEGR
jgi:hypothetical protein